MYMYIYIYVNNVYMCIYIYIYIYIYTQCKQRMYTNHKQNTQRDKTQTAVENLYGLLSTIFTPFYINLDCLQQY